MLETLGLGAESAAIDAAVRAFVESGQGTPDIGGTLGTRETGDDVARRIADFRLPIAD
jgi:isocitrate/isopropylmalate dehydrogenase